VVDASQTERFGIMENRSTASSAFKEEPEAGRVLRGMTASGAPKRMSAANYLEAAKVVDANRNPLLSRRFDDLIARSGLIVETVDREQAEIARAAYRDFGKGGGRPAGLNFGDCFAYALARARREPLLFKGGDFSQTDVAVA
jgi:ribonuclease VapC